MPKVAYVHKADIMYLTLVFLTHCTHFICHCAIIKQDILYHNILINFLQLYSFLS